MLVTFLHFDRPRFSAYGQHPALVNNHFLEHVHGEYCFCTGWEPLWCEFAPVALGDRPLVEGVSSTSPLLLKAIQSITGTRYRQAACYTSVTLGNHLCLHITPLHTSVCIPQCVKAFSVNYVCSGYLEYTSSVTLYQGRTTSQCLTQEKCKMNIPKSNKYKVFLHPYS